MEEGCHFIGGAPTLGFLVERDREPPALPCVAAFCGGRDAVSGAEDLGPWSEHELSASLVLGLDEVAGDNLFEDLGLAHDRCGHVGADDGEAILDVGGGEAIVLEGDEVGGQEIVFAEECLDGVDDRGFALASVFAEEKGGDLGAVALGTHEPGYQLEEEIGDASVFGEEFVLEFIPVGAFGGRVVGDGELDGGEPAGGVGSKGPVGRCGG